MVNHNQDQIDLWKYLISSKPKNNLSHALNEVILKQINYTKRVTDKDFNEYVHVPEIYIYIYEIIMLQELNYNHQIDNIDDTNVYDKFEGLLN